MASHWTLIRVAVLLLLLPFFAEAQAHGKSEQPPRSAPPNAVEGTVHRVDLEAGKIVRTTIEPAPHTIPADPALLPQKPAPSRPVPPSEKLHPRLQEWLHTLQPIETVQVVITFEDSVKIPRFPSLDPDSRRTDPKNAPARVAAAKLVRELKKKRAPIYEQHREDLAARFGAKVIETFWLIDAVVAEMPLGSVSALTERKEVLAISPVDSGEPPPGDDGDARNDVIRGRARIASDPYFISGGFIGLLDTGVRATHRQFVNPLQPSPIDLHLDCVTGGPDCSTGGNPDDNCWNHGTSSAAILAGNGQAGDAFRGVTGATLDSFKVYAGTLVEQRCKGGLDAAAAVRGFQAAVAALDQVIVAEIQAMPSERGPISLAANAAFDAGAVVIAANGNYGSDAETVAEPANASRVLGVGDFDVINGGLIKSQGRGPTRDKRIKPDFQAPTNTETASTGCAPARLCSPDGSDKEFRIFGETSGATPYAAGAAALMRNLVGRAMKTTAVDPGFVYALMILSGQKTDFDNDYGTGPLRLPPPDSTLLWGTVSVSDGEIFEVRIPYVHPPERILDAALWWPEAGVQSLHNNIDLMIVDRAGREQTASRSVPSVFERVRFQGSIQDGSSIRIQGTSVPSGPQQVYFAILSQRAP